MSEHSDQNESSIFKIALNLTVACFISGLIIATVYYFTADAAAEKLIELRNEAMRSLVADADEFIPEKDNEAVFKAIKNGKTIAYVAPGEHPGYEGTLQVLVAVALDRTIIDYEITAHKETPGLGDKAGVAPFKNQFIGKKAAQLIVVKDPTTKENINALTGATISSRAVNEAIKKALAEADLYIGRE